MARPRATSRAPKPDLRVVRLSPAEPQRLPPANLDATGRALWDEVTTVFAWDDPGNYRVLEQCCFALQRAERCRAVIDEQGEMLMVRGHVRSHPLLRDELQNRAFVVRSLAKLGLDLAPLRSGPGRPPGR